MLKEIVIAIQSYFRAHQFIIKHRLWKWILIPGILYTILFCFSIYFFGKALQLLLITSWCKPVYSIGQIA